MIHLILKKFGQKNDFFGDQKGDFTIKKPNFPENTLVYCNQEQFLLLEIMQFILTMWSLHK